MSKISKVKGQKFLVLSRLIVRLSLQPKTSPNHVGEIMIRMMIFSNITKKIMLLEKTKNWRELEILGFKNKKKIKKR